jgi:MFS superfamily sulfate permease-like transporter
MASPSGSHTPSLATVLFVVGAIIVLVFLSVAMIVPQWVVAIAVVAAIVWFLLARRSGTRL